MAYICSGSTCVDTLSKSLLILAFDFLYGWDPDTFRLYNASEARDTHIGHHYVVYN